MLIIMVKCLVLWFCVYLTGRDHSTQSHLGFIGPNSGIQEDTYSFMSVKIVGTSHLIRKEKSRGHHEKFLYEEDMLHTV